MHWFKLYLKENIISTKKDKQQMKMLTKGTFAYIVIEKIIMRTNMKYMEEMVFPEY